MLGLATGLREVGGWAAAELILSVINIQYSLFDAFFAIFTCKFETVSLTPPPLWRGFTGETFSLISRLKYHIMGWL